MKNIFSGLLLIGISTILFAGKSQCIDQHLNDSRKLSQNLESQKTAITIAQDLQLGLYPTSSLAEFQGSSFWTCNENLLELKHQLGRLTDEEYFEAMKLNEEILEMSASLVDLMTELESRGALLYIVEGRDGSPIEGYESGYLAILDGIPYYFSEADKLSDIFDEGSNTNWLPKKVISNWRKENQKHEPNDTDNPVNSPENPKNHTDD